MSDIPDKVIDVAADAVGEVAHQAEGAEQVIRSLKGVKLAYASLGVVIGAAAGGAAAFWFTRRHLETKYNQIAEDEIDAMRDHFRQKLVARDEKPDLSDLAKQHQEVVDESGYSGDGPPMAVKPPETLEPMPVEDAADHTDESPYDGGPSESLEEHRARLRSEGIIRDPQMRNVFEENPPPDDVWNYTEELSKRSPLRPYVIHVDERAESSYVETTYTYYALDDVLCNEGDEVLGRDDGERDRIVGELNLNKFGHGSGDRQVVYVRNDKLEMDIEICLNQEITYAQEVHGFDPPPEPEIRHGDRRRGKPRFDDE